MLVYLPLSNVTSVDLIFLFPLTSFILERFQLYGVNFTNILRAAFFVRKSTEQLFCTRSLGVNVSGGARKLGKKAARKTLVKLATVYRLFFSLNLIIFTIN
jgi:hypothetical protein